MASNVSQAYTESKSQFRDGDCDGEEEEDGEEMLDPRVKVHYTLALQLSVASTTPHQHVIYFFPS